MIKMWAATVSHCPYCHKSFGDVVSHVTGEIVATCHEKLVKHLDSKHPKVAA